jgi:translation initiation factor 1A
MPNIKGGKAYKKTKHASTENEPFTEIQKDQMYGRVVRNLGGLNLMVYCNDNKERICHIRGSMRKRVWMNAGDVVIISFRELSSDDSAQRGDIVAKVDPKFYARIRKDPDVNERLFIGKESGATNNNDESGFIFANEGEDVSDEDSSNELQKEKQQPRHNNARVGNYVEGDNDVDIDDI